jgi:hypothetical protein
MSDHHPPWNWLTAIDSFSSGWGTSPRWPGSPSGRDAEICCLREDAITGGGSGIGKAAAAPFGPAKMLYGQRRSGRYEFGNGAHE